MTVIDPEAIALRPFRAEDAGWLARVHGELYARDEGFDASFRPLVAGILDGFVRDHDPAVERGWIAEHAGGRLGSIFCVRGGAPAVAKLRLFLLLPEARGLGLGRRMLGTCLSFARDAGYGEMRLWTHESHRAACALYRRSGFVCTRSEPVHSFGQDLIEQTWEIAL